MWRKALSGFVPDALDGLRITTEPKEVGHSGKAFVRPECGKPCHFLYPMLVAALPFIILPALFRER